MPGPTSLDAPLTEADVIGLFQTVLRRDPDNPDFTRQLVENGTTLRSFITDLRGCEELRHQMRAEIRQDDFTRQHDASFYRCPQDLVVNPTQPRRVLLLGSCLMAHWRDALANLGIPTDMYLTGGELPDHPAQPIDSYDLQIVHLPLRSMLPDSGLARLGQDDVAGHEKLFAHAQAAMRAVLRMTMRWNVAHGLLTLVFPFLLPQQNPVGRLLPRYDLRNPVHFLERLNQALAQELTLYPAAWFVDLNDILATHGKRFVQEDAFAQINHGSFMIDFDFTHDANRLEPAHRLTDTHPNQSAAIITAAWHEVVAVLRSIRQTDMVKMVVVDLDDTLWRGTIGELSLDDLPTSEGWPRALWEALSLLKRRGILLAIISQNDEARVVQAWDRITARLLKLDDFAIRRIDWRPKSIKMAEVLQTANLLARSVVYIDDNPVQRREIAAAFPDLRTLGGDPFTWRHILLWSGETQTAGITTESTARTEMVQAQAVRETARALHSREDFLASLQLQMTIVPIDDISHASFPRALELLNKTNQFNTTGERHTQAGCAAALAAGASLHAFTLSDVYTDYGLVGVLMVDQAVIRQFVMSCRVFGLDAELAAVAHIAALAHMRGHPAIAARLIDTDRNQPCRNIYQRCGFTLHDGGWTRATAPPPPIPGHITLTAPLPDLRR